MKSGFLAIIAVLSLLASKLTAATFYVSPASLNPAPPYSSWATAANKIQNAVDAAQAGDLVLVTNGGYFGGVTVSQPLTLLSVNGPDVTWIDAAFASRCLSITNNVTVSGFMLTNGVAQNGGGLWCSSTNAYVTNCVIAGNSATQNGGGAWGATLYNCLVVGNSATNGIGGGTYASMLYNCTVSGNSANSAGGASGGISYNSIIYFNNAQSNANYVGVYYLEFCCTTPAPAFGSGNLTNPPLFAANGDFHLQSSSPCIDAGNNIYVFNNVDLDGKPRVAGATVDIGTYEFQYTGPPLISIQPHDQLGIIGSNLTFTAGATGSLPLFWQWLFNGKAIVDATNAYLALSPITTGMAGDYSAVVTNYLGSVTSQVAILTVSGTPPSISQQPLSQQVNAGDSVTFSAAATSTSPLAWQWFFNGAPVLQGTNPSLTLSPVAASQAGAYWVVVTNLFGSATSQVAALTVLSSGAPAIALQPVGQTVHAGDNVTFTAAASGAPPLFWQWQFNGTPIPGATTTSLTLGGVSTNQAGRYSVIVSNSLGHVPSVDAILNVLPSSGVSYVWAGSPSPTPPYDSWGTAAHTIQDAVDVAAAGQEILVTNGLYATGGHGDARLVLALPLTVRSVNGPAVTVIQGYQVPGTITGYGGIRCAYLDEAVLSGFTLTGGASSSSNQFGGGVYCVASNSILENCIITGNAASGSGGGAYGGTLNNCLVSSNSAYLGGGAYSSLLNQCTVTVNSASEGAGTEMCTLNGCTITTNSASAEGGGAADSALNNCVLTGNSGIYGGGAFNCSLNNCTLTGNSALTDGGGAEQTTLNNCIAYYNSAPTGPNCYGCTVSYSCTTPLPNGPGNFADEPLLASASHLSAQSPCIGRGSHAFTSGVDIDGEPWLNPPCVGADQLVPGDTSGALAVNIGVVVTNVSTGFTVPFQALIDGRLLASAWDFGDGVVVSNHPYASHAWAAPGTYAVRLTGYNDSYPGGVSATVSVIIAAQNTFYVNAANTTPAAPYTNWASAANNIQDAIDAGTQLGRLVLVADGVYSSGGRAVAGAMTNRVVLTQAVEVRSVNGPVKALISGAPSPLGTNNDGAIRCVYVGPNSVLNGFTLTNGYTRADWSDPQQSGGGGAWCEASGVVTNCIFSGNSAVQGGGAYWGTLNNCVLKGNLAGFLGGGASAGTLNNCALVGNSAEQGGGAEAATLNYCTVSGNSASQGGGAENGVLNNCAIFGNSAWLGGGVYEAALFNCTVTANSATQGGGAYSSTGTSVLNNCTVTGNFASDSGGGTYSSVMNNCIVYYNSAPTGPNYFSGSAFSYSCMSPVSPGPGNFETEPLLASATHLSAQSPCIGQGNPAFSTGVDIDGESWLNPPCMGADQFVAGHTASPVTVNIGVTYTNVSVGFAVPVQALIAGQLTASVWDFGDGVVVSNRPYASHTWAAAGLYPVTLTAYNDGNPNGVSAAVQVQVNDAQVYYVNAANTAPAPPYTNWAGAARNIQDAVDAGSQLGRLVLVADGIYDSGGRSLDGLSTNRLVVPEGVQVRSVNGPAVTVIAGQAVAGAGIRCAYVGTNAVLSGFTLTNGNNVVNNVMAENGGGAWCEASAVLTNCILTGNSCAGNGGGVYGGTLFNCMLSSNSCGTYGGGAANATLNKCTLAGNRASSAGGVYDATLNYCTLTGNTSGSYGGGAFQSALNNCVLSGNLSFIGGGAFGGTLSGCTVVGNVGIFGGGANSASLYNCILVNNGAEDASGCTVNYCCTTSLSTNGVGNIAGDPLFVDYAGGNFHLQPGSPCINAGNNAYVSGTNDLDGNPRIVGGTVDLGAYEFQGAGSVISLAWLRQYGLPTDGSADFIDSDGDGMNNWQEWVCGTCPTNPLSVLRMLSVTPTANNVNVTWQSVAGINYFLERCPNLDSSFPLSVTNALFVVSNGPPASTNMVLVAPSITGQPGTTTFTDTNTAATGPFFYRVGVRAP